MEEATELRDFYKDVQSAHAQQTAEHTYERSRQMADTARERARFLQTTRRKLPGSQFVAATRGRIPHVTSRVRHHPDYSRVVRWYRAFGHQRLAFSHEEFLSALGTRRASDIYEYWSLFALFSALRELGYVPRFQQVSELVREDVFDLEIWSDQPISFVWGDEGETLTVWYERKARYLPGQTKAVKAREWKKHVATEAPKAPPGLYSRDGPKEPDFWFELRRGEHLAVAVGDAIFSEGADANSREASSDVLRKARKVSDYVRDLILVDEEGRVHQPLEPGLIVFCGQVEDVDLLEEKDSSAFLPLRPVGASAAGSPRGSIPLDPSCLKLLDNFLGTLREALPG
jgi:hypothetical protein